ncbi:uncharacterized protein C8A04DRAFT_35982 [Dichotomopilus funicola]|uniref:adenosine deaminase n=1 Tax=Dichotomopilus funicola TaxID=1934379 RepID=A0AAN6V6H1_9PEZI|nr:hypothetical protein C8A04DRAFT_35982 [Dichotomopilus funicola]
MATKAFQGPTQSNNVKTPRQHHPNDHIANPCRSSPLGLPKGSGGDAVKEQNLPKTKRLKHDHVAAPDVDEALRVTENELRGFRATADETVQPSDGTLFQVSKKLDGQLTAYAERQALEYGTVRQQAFEYERSLGFDSACTKQASEKEIAANAVLQQLKKDDIARFYDKAPKKEGYRGQEHARFYGDHFLSNAELIEQTQVFALCRDMPKGAHLHIHFNSNLAPSVLLGIAQKMDRMFIWSNIPLNRDEAFDLCRIQFSIMSPEAVMERGERSPFDKDYQGGNVMQFRAFRAAYPDGEEKADNWLERKLVFQEEEAHHPLQTAEGAWEKFNARTQMMKGLFNYETAYREYTRQCLAEFVDDKIQYAEIRPNFMSSNQVWKDDGSLRIDNVGIMDLIISEYEAFQEKHQNQVLKGLKVIYCTPRSFSEKLVGEALMQCFQFKKHKRFGPYIAGFDLVGEESKGKPLKAFTTQFLHFQALCKTAEVEIPFLFHCGETLDIGTDTDGNLLDALLLGARRIGHGFALPRHPFVMDEMRRRGVCVEVCPISNEILGLTPRISGHAMYNLLANNVPCTISTDNGTLFRSRLSHDFYQVMAGKPDMTLHGLRQLAEWSIKHACLDEPGRREALRADWVRMWDAFCQRIIDGAFTNHDSEGEEDGVGKP